MLTFSEYEEAFLATVQCIQEAGIIVDDTTIYADESYILSLWYPDEAHLRDGDPKAASCQLEYFSQISRVWSMRDMSKYQSIYAAALESLISCVRGSGLDLPQDPSDDDLHRYRDAFDPSYFRCLKGAQEESRLSGWSP